MISQKKNAIMVAAEDLFAKQGFTETKIASIAEASGVHEASIYAYFKNKRNILFNIYGLHLKKAVQSLREHYQGMREPGPKLRKAIWHHLYDMKEHPNFAKVWMLAHQVGPDFSDTRFYRYQKEYSDLVIGPIIEGQKECFFDPHVSPRLIRNFALGASAFTIISSITGGSQLDPDENSDQIYNLVIAAVGAQANDSLNHMQNKVTDRVNFRRQQILRTAVEIFAKYGYSNATISQIAQAANLGDATLYEYFENKASILLSISSYYMNGLLNMPDNFIVQNESSEIENKLRKIIWRWIWHLWSDEAYARVLVIELFRNENFYSSGGCDSYFKFRNNIKSLIKDGQTQGVFVPELNSETYINMIIGSLDQFLLSQFMLKREQVGIGILNDTVNALIRAIKLSDS